MRECTEECAPIARARNWTRALTFVVSTHLVVSMHLVVSTHSVVNRKQEYLLLPSLQNILMPNLDKELSTQLEDGGITPELADGAD